jgi:hypothetical protein
MPDQVRHDEFGFFMAPSSLFPQFFSFNHAKAWLDVLPARNALKTVCGQFNHLIDISTFTPSQRTMHGRRVFIFFQ